MGDAATVCPNLGHSEVDRAWSARTPHLGPQNCNLLERTSTMTRPPEIDLLPPRPEADRPLDAGIVLRALREQFPSRVFAHAAPLPPGWARDPYVVDGQLVAHFPRNAEVAGWLDWDEAILRFVDSALGSTLRVPRVRS